jgi:hypothetical protein
MKLFEMYPEMLLQGKSSDGGGSHSLYPSIRGLVLMCSVPPSGNGPMTVRYLRRSLRRSWLITAGFALKRCCTNQNLCRFLFFGGSENKEEEAGGTVSDDELVTYMSYFKRDSEATIDLIDLSRRLPSRLADPQTGQAPYIGSLPPCLVVGASGDVIVDQEGIEETARYFGCSCEEEDNDSDHQRGLVTVDSPHDVMLGKTWRNGARAIEKWLSRCVL